MVVVSIAPIFFVFSFFAKYEEFVAIFREKRKKILLIKIVKLAFALTIFFNFWMVKISRQDFSSCFVTFLPYFKVEYAGDIVEL